MKERDPIYIGKVVERIRRSKGMTQEELAEQSVLSVKTIYRIENDLQDPGLTTLYWLAIGFDMEFLDFMKEIDHHFKTNF